jgi:hypothetical protein
MSFEDGSLLDYISVCSVIEVDQHFRGLCCLHLISAPETSVSFYEATQRSFPEESYLHIRCCENLESNLI